MESGDSDPERGADCPWKTGGVQCGDTGTAAGDARRTEERAGVSRKRRC